MSASRLRGLVGGFVTVGAIGALGSKLENDIRSPQIPNMLGIVEEKVTQPFQESREVGKSLNVSEYDVVQHKDASVEESALDGEEDSVVDDSSDVSSISSPSFLEASFLKNEISRFVGQSAVDKLMEAPATEAEVNGAVRTIKMRPDVRRKILPPSMWGLDDEVFNSLVETVKEVFEDSNLICEARENIKIEKKLLANNQTHFYQSSGELRQVVLTGWEKMQQEYGCTICRDVLSAPHLCTACSHSYCYACIEDLRSRCTSTDEVVFPHCPQCDEPIKTVSFERNFHNSICSAAANFPDHVKADWLERTKRWEAEKKREKPKKEKPVQNNRSWYSHTEIFVSALAVAIVVLIIAVRR